MLLYDLPIELLYFAFNDQPISVVAALRMTCQSLKNILSDLYYKKYNYLKMKDAIYAKPFYPQAIRDATFEDEYTTYPNDHRIEFKIGNNIIGYTIFHNFRSVINNPPCYWSAFCKVPKDWVYAILPTVYHNPMDNGQVWRNFCCSLSQQTRLHDITYIDNSGFIGWNHNNLYNDKPYSNFAAIMTEINYVWQLSSLHRFN